MVRLASVSHRNKTRRMIVWVYTMKRYIVVYQCKYT